MVSLQAIAIILSTDTPPLSLGVAVTVSLLVFIPLGGSLLFLVDFCDVVMCSDVHSDCD